MEAGPTFEKWISGIFLKCLVFPTCSTIHWQDPIKMLNLLRKLENGFRKIERKFRKNIWTQSDKVMKDKNCGRMDSRLKSRINKKKRGRCMWTTTHVPTHLFCTYQSDWTVRFVNLYKRLSQFSSFSCTFDLTCRHLND